MIHDEDLRSSIDYSEGQKQAAHRVLVELVNLFNESDKRSSMKKRLLERQKQASQQAPPREQKPKHKVREL